MKHLRADQEAGHDHDKRQQQPGRLGRTRQPERLEDPCAIEEREQQNAGGEQHTQRQPPVGPALRRPHERVGRASQALGGCSCLALQFLFRNYLGRLGAALPSLPCWIVLCFAGFAPAPLLELCSASWQCEMAPPLALPAGWASRPPDPLHVMLAAQLMMTGDVPKVCRDLDHRCCSYLPIGMRADTPKL